MKYILLSLVTICLLLTSCTSTSTSDPEATALPPKTAQLSRTPVPTLVPTALPAKTTSPTEMIPSTPSVNQVNDPDKAIAYAYDWLIQQDLEQGLSYENANYAQVEFPNGDMGHLSLWGFAA